MRFSLGESVVVRDNVGRTPRDYPGVVSKVGRKYVTVSGRGFQDRRFDGETGSYEKADYSNYYHLLSHADVANRAARAKADAALRAALADIQLAKLDTARMLTIAEAINSILKAP